MEKKHIQCFVRQLAVASALKAVKESVDVSVCVGLRVICL